MQVQIKFSDKEIKELLRNMVVIVDTREQKNQHILDFFEEKKINYEIEKINAGDYSIKFKANEDLNIRKDIYLPVSIEKKNSVDELASSIKDRVRFEGEFIRAKANNMRIYLLVEEKNGYENILKGNYRSQYDKKALMASLNSFESRYNFSTIFLDKGLSGEFIARTLYYAAREYLKN